MTTTAAIEIGGLTLVRILSTLLGDDGGTTVVPDRLGRGESLASARLDLRRELSMLRAMIDAAGGSAVLVRHSSGCAISLAATAAGLAK